MSPPAIQAGPVLVNNESTVTLGKISGVFGVQGWVKVYSFTQPRENITTYRTWLLCRAGELREITVRQGQAHGKSVIAQLAGVSDRDTAQALVDWEIRVPRSALAPAAPGEYYWADLEGMTVCTHKGHDLGCVTRMLDTPAHDVMVIQGERERLVPFVQGEVVLEVDLGSRKITVDWDPEF